MSEFVDLDTFLENYKRASFSASTSYLQPPEQRDICIIVQKQPDRTSLVLD